eukprot:CAMPEP_0116999330 /NCGR_PEP_ID=MMETSP0472-20121206/2074_1 /TAXON_ID=693140 ORGANISM="Tiarina fusus, Strain LIS" /NCGR_SAMPLE_ID=MMETSP0472 /ASSEMBLY_ACC=CAM_ASM_000603 /LENGTH=78 /DNA_ID=CAMNT_0004698719 /DNA_START=317 /DNA_END=549 /DNA_ORIENTATION=-
MRLSSPYGTPSAAVQARAPIVTEPTSASSIAHPSIQAVPKQAADPETEVPLLNLGDRIDDPIQEAMGSANAKHSTAYR